MKTKTPIPQLISTLLLLAISWTTLSGSLQFCYGEAEDEMEWGEQSLLGEGEGNPEDAYRFSGSGEEEEDYLENPRYRTVKNVQPKYQPDFAGNFPTDTYLENIYIAVYNSYNQIQRELLTSPKPPLFILHCTYTSCLPVLA